MTFAIEVSDDLRERLGAHRNEDQSYTEFIEELLGMYETEGMFLQEGYSG